MSHMDESTQVRIFERLEAMETTMNETKQALLGAMGRDGLIVEHKDLHQRVVRLESWRTKILGGIALAGVLYASTLGVGGLYLRAKKAAPSTPPAITVLVRPEDVRPFDPTKQ